MKKQYIIGTDIGTTGAKSTVFTLTGKPVSSAYQEYGCTYPQPLWVEQDAVMLRDAAIATVRDALAKSGLNASAVASIGFSTQRSCTIFLDKSGAPLKMISWQDSRCGDMLSEIRSKVSEADFYRVTGLPLGTSWLLPKILWARRHDPQLFGKTARIVQLHDYILKEFGAEEYYTPETDAGMSAMYDVDNYHWNGDFIERFEIDNAMLPQVKAVSERVGTISPTVAEMTGLKKGLPLYIGIGDISASAVGAGIVSQGDFLVSMGTGGMMVACCDKPMRDPSAAFLVTNHAIHKKWQWEGLQKGSAGTYRWFRDEVASLEFERAQLCNTNVYDVLSAMAKEIPAGSNGLLVLPYFASAGTPRWNNDAKGCILGLTFAHGKAHMARAFMEGVTMEHRDMFESMRKSGVAPQRVRISGGPTKSDLWNAIQAGVYNMPVETLEFADASVMGAAITGAVGAGLFSDIPDAVKNMVRPAKIYEPDAKEAERYDLLYSAFSAAYEGLSQQTFAFLAKL